MQIYRSCPGHDFYCTLFFILKFLFICKPIRIVSYSYFVAAAAAADAAAGEVLIMLFFCYVAVSLIGDFKRHNVILCFIL